MSTSSSVFRWLLPLSFVILSLSQGPQFEKDGYFVTVPDSLPVGDVVFQETLDTSGVASLEGVNVTLRENSSDLFTGSFSNGNVTITVNTDMLEEGIYTLNIWVRGCYYDRSSVTSMMKLTPTFDSISSLASSQSSSGMLGGSSTQSLFPYSSSVTPFSSSGVGFSSSVIPFSSSGAGFSSSVLPFSSSGAGFSSSVIPFSSSGAGFSSSVIPFSSSGAGFSSSVIPFSSSGAGFSFSVIPFSSSPAPSPSPSGSVQCQHFNISAQLNITVVRAVTLNVTSVSPYPTENITFSCNFWNQSLDVEYSWFQNGSVIDGETDATFVLVANFSDNSSVFYCTANNITSDINITIDIQPYNLSVEANPGLQLTFGKNVTLTCTSEGGPTLNYIWILPDDTNVTSNMLSVNNVMMNDTGEYICIVTSEAGIASTSVILSVVPYNITLSAEPSPKVAFGGNVTLTCSSEGGPSLNYTLVTPNKGNVTSQMLAVSNVMTDDAGVYCCVVTSEAGTSSLNITITVGVSIVTNPGAQEVFINDSVIFSCLADGSEPFTYQWYKDDQLVTMDSRLQRVNTSNFTIDPLQGGDFGSYHCQVTNDVDNMNSSTALLTVSPFGSVSVSPSVVTLNVSENVTFTCEFSGGPDNEIKWLKGGTGLANETSRPLLVNVDDVNNGDRYTCVISNAAGNGTGDSVLYVNPIITKDPSNTNITYKDPTGGLICCEAQGFPTPNITWYQNGTVLTDMANVTELESKPYTRTSTVNFINAIFNDSGSYYCVATSAADNVVDARSDTAYVTVQAVPERPVDLMAIEIQSRFIVINWTEPHDNNAPISGYYIFVNNITLIMNLSNQTEYNITELSPYTNYNISVLAFNTIGNSSVSEEIVNETLEDAPDPVMNFSVSELANGSLLLTWVPPLVSNGEYCYIISYTFMSLFNYTDYPDRTETSNDVINITLDREDNKLGLNKNSLLLENRSNETTRIRSYAKYIFTITGVNTRLKAESVPVQDSIDTQSQASTPVLDMTVVPIASSENFSLMVNWDLPQYPNGIITTYEVEIEQNGTRKSVKNTTDFKITFGELTPYQNYTVTVTPFSQLKGFSYSITERTNATTPSPPPVPPPREPGVFEFTINLPPAPMDTGKLLCYIIVVYGPTSTSTAEFQTGIMATFSTSVQNFILDEGERPAMLFRLEEIVLPNHIPTTYTVQGSDVLPDMNYYAFVIFKYENDGGSIPLFQTSQLITVRTAPNNVPLGVGLFFFFFIIIILIIVAVVVVILIYQKKVKKSGYRLNEDALGESLPGAEMGVIFNPSVPTWTGTTEPVPVSRWNEHVRLLHADDDYRFSEEYKIVEPDHRPTTEAFSKQINATKNRYGNIFAYDHSRVHLQEIEGVDGSDYINANFIDGYRSPNCYIASQGPVPDSVNDFWRMVWEQNVPTIVMLTNLEEKDRVKCHHYWPKEKNGTYGEIRVTKQEELVLSDYTVRTFSVVKAGNKEERILTQFHFTVWPDFGVPTSPTPLLLFVRRVTAMHPTNRGPMIVHCSAGVGRSGTFITIQSMLKMIEAEKKIDVFVFVRSMRYRRCLMVQTEVQYIFIHDALQEAIECGDTEVPARDLTSQYKGLQQIDEKSGKTLLELELKRLSQTIHKRFTPAEAQKPANKSKNRFADILPFDETRCRLLSIPGVPGSDYINANFIAGYSKKKAFIATQGPLPDTCADFWRMIWEQTCATIVMLTKEKEGPRVRCHKYWPDGTDTYGQIQVVLISEQKYTEYTLREFKLIDTKDKSSLPLKQFQFTGWPEESGKVPSHSADLIDLIGQVQKWQRTAGERPIVVHCSGGSGRTGTFLAICNLLDRLKLEGVVDVFQTVRGLRMQRPLMVRTLDQYQYCYTTLLEYLDSFDNYGNFK